MHEEQDHQLFPNKVSHPASTQPNTKVTSVIVTVLWTECTCTLTFTIFEHFGRHHVRLNIYNTFSIYTKLIGLMLHTRGGFTVFL